MNKDLKIFIGKKIREYRQKKNLTQKELGDRIGKKMGTISDYEKGKSSPGQDALFKIANVLDVSIDDLFPEPNSNTSLEEALNLSETKFTAEEVQQLKQLMHLMESLPDDDREKVFSDIDMIVNYFNARKNFTV